MHCCVQVNTVVFSSGPVLVSLAAFVTFTLQGHALTAAVAFPALALFNLLRFPIIVFPSQIMNMVHARVGVQRIRNFLESEEMDGVAQGVNQSSPAKTEEYDTLRHQADRYPNGYSHANGVSAVAVNVIGQPAIHISDGTFYWDTSKPPVLSGVNLSINPGSLVVVVGTVGCGKSSLLAAILREMHQTEGLSAVNGSIAYTAQVGVQEMYTANICKVVCSGVAACKAWARPLGALCKDLTLAGKGIWFIRFPLRLGHHQC